MQPSEDRHGEGRGRLGIQQHCRVPLLVRHDRPAHRYSRTGVFAMDGTTQQLNAHNTESRSVCYPWHPWHDQVVVIHQARMKRILAQFRCQLESDERGRTLEIPQWMFDPVICSAMRLQVKPRVRIDALLELKALFADAAVYSDSAVLQAQPHCLTPPGEANATHPATEHSTRAVSSTPARTPLAEPSGDDTSRGSKPVDSTAAATRSEDSAIHSSGSGGK